MKDFFDNVSQILKQFLSIVVLMITILSVKNIFATVISETVVHSNAGVFITFSHNHDYYRRDRLFIYKNEVDALEFVQQKLISQNRIQDIPIIIKLPLPKWLSVAERKLQISLESKYSLNEGEGEIYFGRCYIVELDSEEINHEDLLVLIAMLQKLTPEEPKTRDIDFKKMKNSWSKELAEFQNVIQKYPISAPNKQFLFNTIWQDGVVHFELLNVAANTIQELEPLDGYLAVNPLWSKDSRYVAYASLKEIKIFDTNTNTAKTISLSSILEPKNLEIIISFNVSNDSLKFSIDTNALSNYNSYVYDLKKKNIVETALDTPRPKWAPEETKYFIVQVKAVKDLTEAEEIVAELEDKGYQAYITRYDIAEEDVWYKIRMGRFDNYSEAKKFADEFKKNQGMECFITSY